MNNCVPFILSAPFFRIEEVEKTVQQTAYDTLKAQCLMCPKIISGSKNSTGNFYTHLKVNYLSFST